ncbi:helix-turn-helix domain-containing protein [Rubinisphaera brasiliensis]|uniref:Helix-turn-helix domain protein n=1 Tax=Rubinisphaera brasiliensis (strain ATCC 49424 / DSM 5305 / JCM 21570 / IAM 15109 / NBRC 103401 / IFAM 1448) TaxID=756272 RepID=F0SJ46_RUBBR|nr:helix-turn-helix transcriptional regulator [Rubinisphaera brasiliensis]ADY58588.1 helix-turn-helix domain protein [Rubinisphaera brasiliensis DSM 5305]
MQFGERVRELRKQRGLTQQKLAVLLDVSLSYISKVENERLNAGDYPSEVFVLKLAKALDADEDELLLLTDRVPAAIRQRIRERPDAFRELAKADDSLLDQFLAMAGAKVPRTSKTE